jgi:hypothetical protein
MVEGLSALNIADRLRTMQDNVRSEFAKIYSDDKRDKPVSLKSCAELNIIVNEVYNAIVAERSNYLLDNNVEETEPIDDYILNELFLSYTIFLDAFTEMGLYYVMCGNFPFHNMNYFSQQKYMRAANKLLGDNNG